MRVGEQKRQQPSSSKEEQEGQLSYLQAHGTKGGKKNLRGCRRNHLLESQTSIKTRKRNKFLAEMQENWLVTEPGFQRAHWKGLEAGVG